MKVVVLIWNSVLCTILHVSDELLLKLESIYEQDYFLVNMIPILKIMEVQYLN